MGAPISLDGWQSIWIVGASVCVIFILHQKIQKMAKMVPSGTSSPGLSWTKSRLQRAEKWLCCVCVSSSNHDHTRKDRPVSRSFFNLLRLPTAAVFISASPSSSVVGKRAAVRRDDIPLYSRSHNLEILVRSMLRNPTQLAFLLYVEQLKQTGNILEHKHL